MSESRHLRTRLKATLAALPDRRAAEGATLLIYHRLSGSTEDELDVPPEAFARHLDRLAHHGVVSLDAALDRLDAGDRTPSFVLTFDDGFEDVYQHAWPLLKDRQIPFTVYVAAAYMSKTMRWEGATAKGTAGRGLSWDQLAEMVDSGLCTVGNHTHNHVPPAELTEAELDTCTAEIEQRLGVTPRHFTYPWGVPVPAMEDALRQRFRSASTGELGRNIGLTNRMRLKRVPVRRTDPDDFFAAKLTGNLLPERAYAATVRLAKAVGMSS